MGEVFKARETKLDRHVAIKVFPPGSPKIRIGWRALNGKPRCWPC